MPGGTPKTKFDVGLRPEYQNPSLFMTKICDFPYTIYDLTNHLIPYLNIICEGLLFMVLSIIMKKQLLPNNLPNSRLGCKNHTLFKTKMAKIDILFMTKFIHRGRTYLYSPYKGLRRPPPPFSREKKCHES